MTLEEAIKISEVVATKPQTDNFTGGREATKLGLEALKRVQDMRISPCTTADELLPGETKE